MNMKIGKIWNPFGGNMKAPKGQKASKHHDAGIPHLGGSMPKPRGMHASKGKGEHKFGTF